MANEFKCQACGASFDSKEALDKHNKASHPAAAGSGTGAGAGSSAQK
jgi:hypothetical protein